MRKKYAKRLRREALRLGATIISEGTVIKTGERKSLGLPKKNQGYEVIAIFRGWTYCVADPYDALGAYRLLVEELKYELQEADHEMGIPAYT